MTFPLSDRRAQSYQKAIHKPFCFVPVIGGLGIAVANERGYSPVPEAWARYSSYNLASENADHLNTNVLKLTKMEALDITASTMGGQPYYS